MGVKAKRAKLVLLAPNTETSDVLDDKIDDLIHECHDKEVPIIYCLNRRKLGKAIGKTIKMTTVTIYDPNGVYPEFKKILSYIHDFNVGVMKNSLNKI